MKDKRERAAELFESGLGYKKVASELGLNSYTTREWYATWRAVGTEDFLIDESEIAGSMSYSNTVRSKVVEDRLNGMSVIDVMTKYHIRSRRRVMDWVRTYKKSQ